MKGQVLKPTISIVLAVIAIVALMIALGIFLFVQFILGGAHAEIGNIGNSAYRMSEVISNYQFQEKNVIEPVVKAAIVGRFDEKTKNQLSAELDSLLGQYDFSYEVSLPFSEPEPPKCVTAYSDKHKAVDIAVGCGTPVKAVCSGRMSVIGPGLSGDPVFGGTSKGGQEGIAINHGDDCRWHDYRSLYGCVDIPERKERDVKKGETIGFVSTCGSEKDVGCHLHFGVTKGAIDKEEDPGQICSSIESLLGEPTNVLAKKGNLYESEDIHEFSVPLLFKERLERMVVKIG